MDTFNSLLSLDRVLVCTGEISKEGVLRKLAGVFAGCESVSRSGDIYGDILARERIISTGIGAGIAIPHIHKDYITGVNAAFCVSEVGIDFGSMDMAPVHFVIMILTSGREHERYLRVIARFAHALRGENVRERLLECVGSGEVLGVLNRQESHG